MTTVDLKDIERLARTLDGVNLDDKDRVTLHVLFALAGRATAEKDDVSGFSIVYQMPGGGGDTSGPYPGLRPAGMGDGSVFQSFQWGASSPGGFDIF